MKFDVEILTEIREYLKEGFLEIERNEGKGYDNRFSTKVGTMEMCVAILTEELGFTNEDLDSNGWDADYFTYLYKDDVCYYLNCSGYYGGVRFEKTIEER